ncbi:MAG: PspC domain-containing protein [Steroidobacteraceae bacterium]
MSIADELERLQTLRERGAISAQEYERVKARVLDEAERGNGASGAGTDRNGAEGDFFRRLARSRYDRFLGGVCGGLGRHTDLPSWAWRLIFCVVTIYFGAGLLFYVLLWIFLPLENPSY